MTVSAATSLRPVPAPRGLEHLRVMERAATYSNAAVYELHQRYGEVFAFGFGPIRFIWLVGAEANRFILQERPEAFRNNPAYRFLQPIGGQHALISSDEPEHLRNRRMVQPAFHKRQLEHYLSVIRDHNQTLFQRLPQQQRVDLYATLRPTVLGMMLEMMLGAQSAQHPGLVAAITQMMNFANMPFLAQQFKLPLPGLPWAGFVRARRYADRLIYADIAQRRRLAPQQLAAQPDIISLLLSASDDKGVTLSDLELRDQTLGLVSAGFDTTSAAISWTLYNVLRHPQVLKALEQERQQAPHTAAMTLADLQALPYLDSVVKESLRLYPPAPAGLRYLPEALAFHGYQLPAKSLVAYSIYATQRSAAYYREPLHFRPNRWQAKHPEAEQPPPYAYVPFGANSRYCIGAGMATMIIKMTLLGMLEHFSIQGLWQGEIAETGNTVQPKGGLPVTLSRR